MQIDLDSVVGQADTSVASGHFVAQHGSHGAVDVSYRRDDTDWLAIGKCWLGFGDQGAVQYVVQAVVLDAGVATVSLAHVGDVENGRQVQAFTFPMINGITRIETFGLTDGLCQSAEAQLGEDLADFLGDVFEKVHDELRTPVELLT